jgi:thioester reductase-like protein
VRGLDTRVIRMGQISGAANGLWNTKEWFPSLVQAGQIVGALPGEDSWVSRQIRLKLMSVLMICPRIIGNFVDLASSCL